MVKPDIWLVPKINIAAVSTIFNGLGTILDSWKEINDIDLIKLICRAQLSLVRKCLLTSIRIKGSKVS